ncbi:hypothetical protein OJAV_G00054120 [Oryzias javanicus]|uniref:Uncharacterized protein n=1 Tax=Oryzias javanicus TaxID=123683 RepID=A0A3S2MB14_ORYJA|nr:hypothetical protein OJAV_G00054120 [Oryzias javanicus]
MLHPLEQSCAAGLCARLSVSSPNCLLTSHPSTLRYARPQLGSQISEPWIYPVFTHAWRSEVVTFLQKSLPTPRAQLIWSSIEECLGTFWSSPKRRGFDSELRFEFFSS